MNVYGHLFESLGEKVADVMEEMYQEALAAEPVTNVVQIAGAADPAKITRLPARITRNPSKRATLGQRRSSRS